MIEWIIRCSVANRFLVLMGALFLSIWGTWTIINTPVDALPDLSDVQVIIKTSYPGQAPQIVENQVTYPLTTTMLSVPGAKTVRGFSQFGDSYVYVIFEDGTDPYWARSRVLEYLNQVQGKLPAGVSAELGQMPRVLAGSMNMHWWIAAVSTIWPIYAHCRTGFSNMS
ncbi:cation efflux system protein [Escherichia coli]|nr:cation efflux system protein [Escherichia coli]